MRKIHSTRSSRARASLNDPILHEKEGKQAGSAGCPASSAYSLLTGKLGHLSASLAYIFCKLGHIDSMVPSHSNFIWTSYSFSLILKCSFITVNNSQSTSQSTLSGATWNTYFYYKWSTESQKYCQSPKKVEPTSKAPQRCQKDSWFRIHAI